MAIKLKKRGSKIRVHSIADNGEPLQHSEQLSSKQAAITHIAAMHRQWEDPETIIPFPDGDALTIQECCDLADEKKAIAAEKKYT